MQHPAAGSNSSHDTIKIKTPDLNQICSWKLRYLIYRCTRVVTQFFIFITVFRVIIRLLIFFYFLSVKCLCHTVVICLKRQTSDGIFSQTVFLDSDSLCLPDPLRMHRAFRSLLSYYSQYYDEIHRQVWRCRDEAEDSTCVCLVLVTLSVSFRHTVPTCLCTDLWFYKLSVEPSWTLCILFRDALWLWSCWLCSRSCWCFSFWSDKTDYIIILHSLCLSLGFILVIVSVVLFVLW